VANTLIRSVYLDGVHLAPGTELTDEQAERITNPNATEDRSVKGQDGRKVEDAVKVDRSSDRDDALRGKTPAVKTVR
jgi:hypothetical protein